MLDLVRRGLHADCKLLDRRLAAQVLQELELHAAHAVDLIAHVHRHANRAALIGHGTTDRLPDPPRRIRAELMPAAVLELVGRADQADVAFLNQVEEMHTAPDVLLGDADDQTRVSAHKVLLRGLGIEDVVLERVDVVGR